MSPRWRDERDHEAFLYGDAGETRAVVLLVNLDVASQDGEIPSGQGEDFFVQLESLAPGAGQMAEEPVERVARAQEGVHHHHAGCGGRAPDGGDLLADRIGQRIARALDRRPAEQPNALRIPFGRPHAIDADVVGIAIALAAVSLHLRQLEDRVPLRPQEKELAVVRRGVHHSPNP
jgi:hypothetical protein